MFFQGRKKPQLTSIDLTIRLVIVTLTLHFEIN